MDIVELEKIVIKDTESDGFSDVKCRSSSTTRGSNVYDIITQSGERFCEYMIDIESGEILHKKANVKYGVKIIEDSLNISDDLKAKKISTREFLERNPKKGIVLVGILVLGIMLPGIFSNFEPIGMAIGFILGGMPFVLGTHEEKITRVKEENL